MSKTSQQIQSMKNETKKMYASGYKDAIQGRGFAWKRHPSLNDYRLGYRDGLLKLNSNKDKEDKNPSKRYILTLLLIGFILWSYVVYTGIEGGWL